jgi:hypothetical protein
MTRASLLCLCALAALAVAGAANAQTATDQALPRPVPLRLTLPPMALSRPADLSGPDAAASQGHTEVDHRFGKDGPVAQVGYLCGLGGIGPDSDPPGGGPSSLWNHQGTFLGASLGYGFR